MFWLFYCFIPVPNLFYSKTETNFIHKIIFFHSSPWPRLTPLEKRHTFNIFSSLVLSFKSNSHSLLQDLIIRSFSAMPFTSLCCLSSQCCWEIWKALSFSFSFCWKAVIVAIEKRNKAMYSLNLKHCEHIIKTRRSYFRSLPSNNITEKQQRNSDILELELSFHSYFYYKFITIKNTQESTQSSFFTGKKYNELKQKVEIIYIE